MDKIKRLAALTLAVLVIGIANAAQGQVSREYSRDDRQIGPLLTRIQQRAVRFQNSFQQAVNRNTAQNTGRDERVIDMVTEFQQSVVELRARYIRRQATNGDVQTVLDRAARIDEVMQRRQLGSLAESDWRLLRTDLDSLANSYNIAWNWERSSDDRQIGPLLTRIQQRAVRFQTSFQQAVNRDTAQSTRRDERLNDMMTEFQQSVVELRARYIRRQATNVEVQAVLDRAARIDEFMQRRQLGSVAESDWRLLRTDLDSLASSYNIAWNWERPRDDRGPGGPGGFGGDARLTGTFRLNPTQSDNARTIVERAVRSLAVSDRQRVTESLLRRVDSPEMLSIERHGQSIVLASSRAPQMTFDADGIEHVEQTPSGRTMRVVARLVGDQLEINTTGDRSSDFNVTFDPINGGRQLRVTRRLSSERLNEPIVVQSTYDQVSNVARSDIYTGPSSYPNDRRNDGPIGNNDFIVPDGTVLVTRLNNDLDTNRVHPGDRFSLTVISPREFDGATIEGQIADVNRSGRVTGRAELALNFDTIRLRNGRSGRFEGLLESVRAANGETVRIDTEGSVTDSSQTNRTVTRTAIGSAIGAIIGAVAGGGKGAAIGAVVGGGAGAGSVIAQGRNDLRLTTGSEITIRASAPNRRASR